MPAYRLIKAGGLPRESREHGLCRCQAIITLSLKMSPPSLAFYKKSGHSFRTRTELFPIESSQFIAVHDSAIGTWRHCAATQQFSRFRSEADMNRQARPAAP